MSDDATPIGPSWSEEAGGEVWYYVDLLRADDIAAMKKIATDAAARVILDIGSFCGGSVRVWAEASPGATIVAVDTWEGTPGDPVMDYYATGRVYDTFLHRIRFQLEAARRTIPIRGRSVDVMTALPDGWFDLVWIDADHHDAEVRADIAAASRLVKVDGVLCGHDYSTDDAPDVKRVVDEVLGAPFPLGDDCSVWAFWKGAGGTWIPVTP